MSIDSIDKSKRQAAKVRIHQVKKISMKRNYIIKTKFLHCHCHCRLTFIFFRKIMTLPNVFFDICCCPIKLFEYRLSMYH